MGADMVITDSTNRNRNALRVRIAGVLCVSTLAYCAQVSAQGAEFHGGIQVGVLRTDNALLAPSPDEIDDTVYQASPYFDLSYENQRITTNIQYGFDWFDYSDLGTSGKFHRYDASFTGQLIQDALFLDLGAAKSQSAVDPDSIIPPEGLPGIGNVGDRDIYFYSPRFEKTFGRSLTVNTHYRYEDVIYDKSDFDALLAIQDNTNESAKFEIQNYTREEGLTWAARYEWEETEYERSAPWEYRQASGELGFWANGKTRLFASGGRESAWDDPVDRSLKDKFWEVGFAYRNGEKLDAEFAVGERGFGSSWRGRINSSFRRGKFALSYAETPTTTGRDRYSRGNLEDPEEPIDVLARPGTAERYISKRGQASMDFDFRRTSLGFVAYDEVRTGRFSDDGTPLGDEAQRGVSMSLAWQFGAKTELLAFGAFSNREFETAGSTDFVTGSLTVSYQLGSSVGLSLGYRYTEQDPDAGSVAREYVSNIVSLFLIYSF